MSMSMSQMLGHHWLWDLIKSKHLLTSDISSSLFCGCQVLAVFVAAALHVVVFETVCFEYSR